MNNIMQMLMGAMRGGADPTAMLTGMAMQNPQLAPVMNIIRGKSPEQLKQTAENMARERGIDLQAMAKQLGLM